MKVWIGMPLGRALTGWLQLVRGEIFTHVPIDQSECDCVTRVLYLLMLWL